MLHKLFVTPQEVNVSSVGEAKNMLTPYLCRGWVKSLPQKKKGGLCMTLMLHLTVRLHMEILGVY